jgi:hypothetical protein
LSLEFNKVVDQVYKLGRMLDEIDLNAGNRLDLAIERFYEATDLNFIHDRVEMTRRPDVSGYRGAAPLDAPIHEVVCQTFPSPEIPSGATIIAADGSQIYPAEQSPVHYFLVNIGLFTYHHGADRVPDQYSVPRLFFHKDHVHDPSGRILSNRTIDARRTATEMHELGAKAWELRDEARPLIALYDNHLLFWANEDVTGARQLMQQYHGALVHLHDSGAILAGYVDNPTRSRVMIRSLSTRAFGQPSETKETRGAALSGLCCSCMAPLATRRRTLQSRARRYAVSAPMRAKSATAAKMIAWTMNATPTSPELV